MTRALVLDTEVLGRNVMRTALERLGYAVTVTGDVLEADTLLKADTFLLVALDGSQAGEAAMNLARRLRQRGWKGVLVFTARLMSDDRLRELARDLLCAAVIMKPMLVEEVEIRLGGVVPPDLDPGRVHEAYVPASWNGALRRARTDYGKNLSVWVSNLAHELSEGRRTGDPAKLQEAHRLTTQLAIDAARFLYQGIAELSHAMAELTQEMIDGRVPRGGSSAAWDDVDALLEVISLAVPAAERSLATVNSAQIDGHERAVLVVTPDVDVLIETAAIAQRRSIGMLSARDLREALRVALRRRIDGALIAHDLPDSGVPLLVEWLQRQPGLSDLPIALLVPPGGSGDAELATMARARGARFVVETPMTERRLVAAVDRLARSRSRRKARVLVLDADREHAAVLKRMLEPHQVEMSWGSSVGDLRSLLEKQNPDAILVDVLVPPSGGLDVCRQVRALARWSNLPVLFLSSQPTVKVRSACFRSGGDAVVPKPVQEEEIIPRLHSIIERSRAVRELDPVTGALHRRAFLVALRELMVGTEEVALGIVDLVGFRQLNLTSGFDAGDRALAGVATAMGDVSMDRGILGRWSADELVLAISGETRTGMVNLLTLVAQKVRGLKVEGADGRPVVVTLESAATSTSRVGRAVEGLIGDAEAALMSTKSGRG